MGATKTTLLPLFPFCPPPTPPSCFASCAPCSVLLREFPSLPYACRPAPWVACSSPQERASWAMAIRGRKEGQVMGGWVGGLPIELCFFLSPWYHPVVLGLQQHMLILPSPPSLSLLPRPPGDRPSVIQASTRLTFHRLELLLDLAILVLFPIQVSCLPAYMPTAQQPF